MNLTTESIGGRSIHYIDYAPKAMSWNRKTTQLAKDQVTIKTLRKCNKCGKYMMINKITKKEWCEYCD